MARIVLFSPIIAHPTLPKINLKAHKNSMRMQPSSSSLICAIAPAAGARAYWTSAPDQVISQAYSTTSSSAARNHNHNHKREEVIVKVRVRVPW